MPVRKAFVVILKQEAQNDEHEYQAEACCSILWPPRVQQVAMNGETSFLEHVEGMKDRISQERSEGRFREERGNRRNLEERLQGYLSRSNTDCKLFKFGYPPIGLSYFIKKRQGYPL